MAFNTLEYLEQGKVDFVYNLTSYDYRILIKNVRNSSKKEAIIDGCIQLLTKDRPRFILEIIYDLEKYKDITMSLITESFLDEKDHLFNLLKTNYGKEYIFNHLYYLKKDDDNLVLVINHMLSEFNENIDYLKKLSIHDDLHLRYLFMKSLVKYYPDKINYFYDDITKYLTSYTYKEYEQLTFLPDLMDNKDISILATSILNDLKDYDTWIKIKEFILKNYEKNYLAQQLLEDEPISEYSFKIKKNTKGKKEFLKDPDRLFETSKQQLYIYKNYKKYIAKELIDKLEQYINYFYKNKKLDSKLDEIFEHDLYSKLKEYVDKYLSLSKSSETYYITSGTTSSTYRLGDYVIKLDSTKWSYEDIICPNLYLIHKNLEEVFVRNTRNIVISGIEVQKYLSRNAREVPKEYFKLFKDELKRLGYYSTDTFINGSCGDNCMLLDSYLDADTRNPEQLPDWFKEYPIVLVDRDRIYEIDNKFPKQLICGY